VLGLVVPLAVPAALVPEPVAVLGLVVPMPEEVLGLVVSVDVPVLVEVEVDGLGLVVPLKLEPVPDVPVDDVPAAVPELVASGLFGLCTGDEGVAPPEPVALLPVEPDDDDPVPLWAKDTPTAAASAVTAAAMVKLFGNLLMWISCSEVKVQFRLVASCSAPLCPQVRRKTRQACARARRVPCPRAQPRSRGQAQAPRSTGHRAAR
jgi:hypothetical protein